LVETTDIVRKRMAAGKTLDQIKTEGLPEEWKTWASGYINTERWLELVYNSLSAKR
jgi:cyclase